MATYVLVPGGWSGGWQLRAWRYHELPTGHVPWETMPQALAHLLHESAQPSTSAA
jgi:hypothetical protein